MVAADAEHVDPVRAPRDRRRIGIEIAAERLPAALAAGEATVPEQADIADHEAVEAARRPGRDADAIGAEAAEALPSCPRRAVPPAVPHRMVAADGEHVDAVGSPGDRR